MSLCHKVSSLGSWTVTQDTRMHENVYQRGCCCVVKWATGYHTNPLAYTFITGIHANNSFGYQFSRTMDIRFYAAVRVKVTCKGLLFRVRAFLIMILQYIATSGGARNTILVLQYCNISQYQYIGLMACTQSPGPFWKAFKMRGFERVCGPTILRKISEDCEASVISDRSKGYVLR